MNELLAKYFSGNASTDEKREVEIWRNQSKENASEFLEASDAWHQQLKGQEFDTPSALSKVKGQMHGREAIMVSTNELLAKCFSDNASSDEKAEVEAWRNQSNENASAYLEASDAWHHQLKGQEFDISAALNKVKDQMYSKETELISTDELLARYFSGDVSLDEKRQIEAWRNRSNENASMFLETSNVWNQQLHGQEFDTSVALDKVKKQLHSKEAKVVSMNSNTIASEVSSFGFMKYAAGIALVVGLGLIYWFFATPSVSSRTTYATLEGEVQDIELIDGTVVTLNEGSQLVVQAGFNNETRSVELAGTAFFDVARDENKPFVIDAGNSEVKVLGTSFLVKSEEETVTEVIVKSGSVALAADNGRANNGVVLSPGEVGIADSRKSGVLKKNNRNANYLAWKDKMITFDRATLTEVAEIINDVYKVEMTFEGNIGNCQLTAQFQEQSVESVVEIISQTFGFDVKSKGKSYKFTGNGC